MDDRQTRRQLAAYFVLAFGLSWLIWVPALLDSWGAPGFTVPANGLLAALMPGVAALCVAGWREGRAGLRRLLHGLTVWRVAPGWYAVALLLRPAGVIAVFAGFSFWQGAALPAPAFSIGALVAMLLIQAPNTLLEELGWRGYALPRLVLGRSWLSAALILGVIHAAWHFPYWGTSPYIQEAGLPAWGLFVLLVVEQTLILTWLYRGTRSVLLTWGFHLTTNTALALLPLSDPADGTMMPLVLDTAVVGLMALGAAWALARAPAERAPALRPAGAGAAGR